MLLSTLLFAAAAARAQAAGHAVTSPAPASYDVVLQPDQTLSVVASFPDALTDALEIDEGFARYVEGLEEQDGAAWKARSMAHASERPGSMLRVRYRFRLATAARSARDMKEAFEQEGALVAPPATWLVRPSYCAGGQRYRLRVTTPPGTEFVTGLFPSAVEGAYEADLASLWEAPYSAFGRFRKVEAEVGGAHLKLAVAPGALALGDDDLRAWLLASGRAVAGYYGRFPMPSVLVLVLPGGRQAIGYGTTLAGGGASIMVWVGAQARPADLADDWVLVHEMTHLGFPTLPREHTWLEEGLATYVEPFARVAAGTMPLEEAWKGLIEGLPRGLPRPQDGGLDGAKSIGRVYWGGALFWFLADLEIRERTASRFGLPDALRAILNAGGDARAHWQARDALERGDAALGLTVLRDLFDSMASKPASVDLPATFAPLGVLLQHGHVGFDDTRPLAGIRRSLTVMPPAPGTPGANP
jgi:hypothetical protein